MTMSMICAISANELAWGLGLVVIASADGVRKCCFP